jgi:flagellin
VQNLAVAGENLQAAESRIRDTDMAAEVVNFMRLKILEDSGVAMLMQANVKPQSVLKLLG